MLEGESIMDSKKSTGRRPCSLFPGRLEKALVLDGWSSDYANRNDSTRICSSRRSNGASFPYWLLTCTWFANGLLGLPCICMMCMAIGYTYLGWFDRI